MISCGYFPHRTLANCCWQPPPRSELHNSMLTVNEEIKHFLGDELRGDYDRVVVEFGVF